MNFVAISFFALSLMIIGIQAPPSNLFRCFSEGGSGSSARRSNIRANMARAWPERNAQAIKGISLVFVYQVLEHTAYFSRINSLASPFTMIMNLATPNPNPPAYYDPNATGQVHLVQAYEGVFDKVAFLQRIKSEINYSINIFEGEGNNLPSYERKLAIMTQVSGSFKHLGFTNAPPEYIAATMNHFLEFYRSVVPPPPPAHASRL